MMKIVAFHKIFPSGTTLLEGIIAIGIIIAAVVGSLVLIMSTIKLGRANQDRVVAQNLAREGMELTYSLRNSASYMRVNNPSISWDSFLKLLVQIDYDKLKEFDIGVDLFGYNNVFDKNMYCFSRGANIKLTPTECDAGPDPNKLYSPYFPPVHNCVSYDYATTAENPMSPFSLNGPPAGGINPIGRVNKCDPIVLANYIFDHWEIPPMCDYSGTAKPCDYDGDGSVTIADVVFMIERIEDESFHFTIGYPTIATTVPAITSPNARLTFYQGADANVSTGVYDATKAWTYPLGQTPLSQVQLYKGTYFQNVNISGPEVTKTKFYRTVTTQEVCRLTSDNKTEYIVPLGNAFGCNLYTKATFPPLGSKKVGVLVTSEVRWPTPTSSTKAVYRELLYDWLSF